MHLFRTSCELPVVGQGRSGFSLAASCSTKEIATEHVVPGTARKLRLLDIGVDNAGTACRPNLGRNLQANPSENSRPQRPSCVFRRRFPVARESVALASPLPENQSRVWDEQSFPASKFSAAGTAEHRKLPATGNQGARRQIPIYIFHSVPCSKWPRLLRVCLASPLGFPAKGASRFHDARLVPEPHKSGRLTARPVPARILRARRLHQTGNNPGAHAIIATNGAMGWSGQGAKCWMSLRRSRAR